VVIQAAARPAAGSGLWSGRADDSKNAALARNLRPRRGSLCSRGVPPLSGDQMPAPRVGIAIALKN
tara:strand:- start:1668 stop:1865 length:198 start_codon:yes stop_codon:yes gene_type:complete